MRRLFLYTAALLCLVSCVKRIGFGKPEPIASEMTVRITPVWNTDVRPTRLNALIYNQAGVFIQEVQLPVDGGELSLPEDHYRVIVYNSDLEAVAVMGQERYEDAAVRAEWGTKAEYFSIPSPGLLFRMVGEASPSNLDVQSAMLHQSSKVIIKLKIEDGGGVKEEALSVSLRNIADALNLATGQAFHSSSNEISRSELTSGGVRDGLYWFEGSAFGGCVWKQCPHEAENRVFADIVIELPNGEQKVLSADITDAMYDAQISITELAIEITIEDMGLRAVVTGWTTGTATGGIGRVDQKRASL